MMPFNKSNSLQKSYVFLAIICMNIYGCATKNIPNNDYLYQGAKINYINSEKKQIDKKLKDKIKNIIQPKENTKFLGMPLKLWIYNIAKKDSNKGLSKFLKSFGESPVLASRVDIQKNLKNLKIAMENEGFFLNEPKGKLKHQKHTAKAFYTVSTHQRWKIDTITASEDNNTVPKLINDSLEDTIIEEGSYYSLDSLKNERERISQYLKERGYFYFDPQYIIFEADTNNKEYKVQLTPKLKDKIPESALTIWKINKVIVNANYKLKNSKVINIEDFNNYTFNIIDKKEPLFKPRLFLDNIFIKPHDTYKYSDHLLSIQRLMEKNIFSFVKVDFKQSNIKQHLDAIFLLSSMKQRFIRIEIGGNIKSNNFIGSGLNITHQNRNLFKQGEYLNIALKTGFDYQISGDNATIKSNAYNIGLNASLIFPRLVTPFYKINIKKIISPKTKISLDASILYSVSNYQLFSANLLAGYSFNTRPWISHELDILDLTYVLPRKVSRSFQTELDKDPVKKRAFAKQYVIGSSYAINYQNDVNFIKPIDYKLNGIIDLGGNLLGLVFKSTFAQYIKLSTTGITYISITPSLILANRIIIGYGYSYGHSYSLPYIKQFYVGGPNSIRAFRTRMLGPGSFKPNAASKFRDEAGDIKLELNTELRFPIASLLKGAAFIDAGNIWNLRHNDTREGGKFTHKFLSQLGIGTGLGLRIDVSLFVIRLDAAFPIHKPWETNGSKWVIKEINPFNSGWRKENLIYNFAIGYPF